MGRPNPGAGGSARRTAVVAVTTLVIENQGQTISGEAGKLASRLAKPALAVSRELLWSHDGDGNARYVTARSGAKLG